MQVRPDGAASKRPGELSGPVPKPEPLGTFPQAHSQVSWLLHCSGVWWGVMREAGAYHGLRLRVPRPRMRAGMPCSWQMEIRPGPSMRCRGFPLANSSLPGP